MSENSVKWPSKDPQTQGDFSRCLVLTSQWSKGEICSSWDSVFHTSCSKMQLSQVIHSSRTANVQGKHTDRFTAFNCANRLTDMRQTTYSVYSQPGTGAQLWLDNSLMNRTSDLLDNDSKDGSHWSPEATHPPTHVSAQHQRQTDHRHL